MGCLYDEVVPCALELTGVDEKRERFIPRSSKYLLYAYQLLQSSVDNRCSHVSIDQWVKFWSKKTTMYHPPPHHKEKKMDRPKSTHNPLGDIAIHERWSIAEEALFAKLCIERSLKEEVYLAAYLACWLCVFVLSDKDVNSIRLSTFKIASLMANGRRVDLAILVLANIATRKLEDEVQSIDVGEESEISHSSTMTPPLGMGLRRKQSPPPAAVSVFKGESFLFNYQKEFLQSLWSGLLVKISNTLIDFLSSIEDNVYLILES
ncbi:UNVERIFIED_CONTAM: hypothetical protein Sangu_2992500 [Sesamum angustifolium]|uniref:Aminotransferase-like plant mobile domain-containing protein n=1 Tax=Sesamum angustifolium TaxID=2727405 RepID=A0AAW2KP39_9LAMI